MRVGDFAPLNSYWRCCMHQQCSEPRVEGFAFCAMHELEFWGVHGTTSANEPMLQPFGRVAWQAREDQRS